MNSLDVAYALGGVLLSPIWARKARGGWRERFGRTAALPAKPPGIRRLLLHAVSVGEVNTLRALVPELAAEPGVQVVVSAGTDTGLARATELFGTVAAWLPASANQERVPALAAAGAPASASAPHTGAADPAGRVFIVRYPLDFSGAVRRFLDAVAPDAVGLVELEVWPNFIAACRRRGIPVGVINGRLSEKSFGGYRKIRALMRRSFESLEFAAVQNAAYAERFGHMGVRADRVRVTDSMKWDSLSLGADEALRARAERLAAALGVDRTRPLVVAGSTAEDEEALLHTVCTMIGDVDPARPGRGVQLLCAPRQPERFDQAAAALPGCVRRSQRPDGTGVPGLSGDRPALAAPGAAGMGPSGNGAGRFLLDTLGELRAAYWLADVVVVGRSFGSLHGSDPAEPAGLGKPIVIGPRHRNFDSAVAALVAAGGLKICEREQLSGLLGELLRDQRRREAMGVAALECVRVHRGATRRHADLLLNLLGRGDAGAREERAPW